MFDIEASIRLKGAMDIITVLYNYDPGLDIYVPKYSAIHGEVMRNLFAATTNWRAGQEGISDADMLVPIE